MQIGGLETCTKQQRHGQMRALLSALLGVYVSTAWPVTGGLCQVFWVVFLLCLGFIPFVLECCSLCAVLEGVSLCLCWCRQCLNALKPSFWGKRIALRGSRTLLTASCFL
jgi:hypothetical protein